MDFYASFLASLLSFLPRPFRPTSVASGESSPPLRERGTVIIGAGVIGLSTAYYLALDLSESGSHCPITVVEASDDICPGASGHATGGLGGFGFDASTSELGEFSYLLHQALASKYNGKKNYGFSDLTIFRISPPDLAGAPSPPDSWGQPNPPARHHVSILPEWIKPSEDWVVHLMAEGPSAAHLSTVVSLERASSMEEFNGVTIQTDDQPGSTAVVPCHALVIAAGPWSEGVFLKLFPDADIRLKMNNRESAGNHILIKSPRPNTDQDGKAVQQVFLDNMVHGPHHLNITSFLDGSLYIGGWGAEPEDLPNRAGDTKAQPDETRAMIRSASQYLRLEPGETPQVIRSGRCYRPVAVPNRPIITKVEWSLLGEGGSLANKPGQDVSSQPHPRVIGGLYINTGHNTDGITLGPGSGKLMSELLLGREPSIPLSGFGMK